MQTLGNIIIFIGIIFMSFGVIGIFKFKNFYERIIISAKIDTVGAFTLIIGMIIKHGFGFFSLKLLLIMVLMVIINPLIAHITAGSAHASGYKIDGCNDKEEEEQL